MIFTPLNLSDIIDSVVSTLLADDYVQRKSVTVERSCEINEDPGKCPWVGIYRTGVQYPSRILGMGSGFRQQKVGMLLMTQGSSNEDGEKCERELEALNTNLLRILLTDQTVGGRFDVIEEMTVIYRSYGLTENGVYLQTSSIEFTGVTNVTGSGG